MVGWLFLAVSWGCLRFVIVVFPDHTHLLFCHYVSVDNFSTELFKGKLLILKLSKHNIYFDLLFFWVNIDEKYTILFRLLVGIDKNGDAKL